ncbi:MAG: type II toxin-antitoxin system Phd/YefM family antitoxin [Cyanobacteria bacterium]|nr:type II toxin-antitoxin system Phd/YefM family antitoxin [Cyanobacteriota bacterium]
MATVNVHQAKTQLSKLLQQVEAGETIVIARAGKPLAQLVPINAHPKGIKPPGAMRDQISIGDDFDLPLDGLFDGNLEPSGPEQP